MGSSKIGKYLALIVGLSMLAGAWFSYKSTTEFLGAAVSGRGEVVDFFESRSSDSITYRPVVSFETDTGQLIRFTSSTGSNPPAYNRGETVEVLYDPLAPDNAQINGFFSLWGVPVIFVAIGGLLSLIGIALFVRQRTDLRTRGALLTMGTPIQTQFSSAEKNSSIKADGRYPYRIYSQWKNPRTNRLHIFESANIWYNPESHIKGDQITVFIDPSNPKKYVMDLSFLPDVAD